MGPLLEKDIQRSICDWLALRGVFFWRSNNIPVFGMSGDGTKRFRSLPKYTMRGIADIICVHKGKFVALEVKRPGNRAVSKLSEDQVAFGLKVESSGGFYYVVHSLEEVQAIAVFA